MNKNDKLLYDNKWVSLYETPDGYVYSHQTMAGGDGVAILVYDLDTRMYYGRFEKTPCHSNDIQLCSITGTVENNDPLGTAVMELMEEAGMEATSEELEVLGTCRPSKSSDTTMHLYAVNGTNKAFSEPKGDGTAGEIGAYCKWVSEEEAIQCKDPLMALLISRFRLLDNP